MEKMGVIDLGTNTFHLLIAEWLPEGGGIREIYRERRFVKLAEEGIGRIGEAAFRRGLETIRIYHEKLAEFGVRRVRAIGTAALRTADNGPVFVQQVKRETGLEVELISGDREAELIHRGVLLAVPFGPEPFLIIDPGGGSVEFIIADDSEVHWARSFPIGLAVLYHKFHRSDPLSSADEGAVRGFLDEQLEPLFSQLTRRPLRTLVGASGTFDVLESMLPVQPLSPASSAFPAGSFQPVFRRFLPTTVAQRLAMPDLPGSRADMFIMALLLVDHLIRRTGAEEVIVSNYALKEGVLFEMGNLRI